MSDTPRTDAEASDGFSGDAMCVTENFARTLERDLAAARAEIERLRGLAEHAATDALGQEGVKIMRESLRSARAELAEALNDRDEAREKARLNEPRLICMESGEVKIAIAHKVMQNLVETFAELNKGAQNYTESRFECGTDGRAFIVTVQNAGAKSPHQLRVEVEKELAEARGEMRRYLPVLERVERAPLEWELATMGTGIATLNGYRKAAGVEG